MIEHGDPGRQLAPRRGISVVHKFFDPRFNPTATLIASSLRNSPHEAIGKAFNQSPLLVAEAASNLALSEALLHYYYFYYNSSDSLIMSMREYPVHPL